jgi:uncharacterized protein YjdB
MTEDEQAFYDSLNQMCAKFIMTDVDAKLSTYGDYYISSVKFGNLTYDRAIEIAYVFVLQNPQYYFVRTGCLYSSTSVALMCYSDFADGETRLEVTDQVFTKLDAWIDEVSQYESSYEKERAILQMVCDATVYESNDYDQSMYGPLICGKSVCTGYTQLFSAMANAVGLSCVTCVSETHAWNIIYLDGAWYNVDATWADQDGYIWEKYVNYVDSSISDTSHEKASYYVDLVPACDSASNYVASSDTNSTVLVEAVAITPQTVTMEIGSSETLTAAVTPENADNTSVKWTSSDPLTVYVSGNGELTALQIGEATITCIAQDGSGVSTTCVVTVTPVMVKEITLNKTTASLTVGDCDNLIATVTPSDAENTTVIWNSGNTDVATVDDNGTITAVAAGSTTITCTAADGSGKSASCTVTVTNPVVIATGVTLNKSSLSLEKGKTETLTATVEPTNVSNSTVAWKSSNTAVATVSSSGVVTAIAAGSATITCTTADGSGKSASCTVTVTNPTDTTDTTDTTGTPSTTTTVPVVTVSYRTHVQSFGWQSYVTNGAMSGTSGKSKRLEGINITVSGNSNLGIQYTTHCQSYGWLPWSSNGDLSGTEGGVQASGSNQDSAYRRR